VDREERFLLSRTWNLPIHSSREMKKVLSTNKTARLLPPEARERERERETFKRLISHFRFAGALKWAAFSHILFPSL
jgi:hypothetical protein